ncbi:hypothetical protein HMPREF1210_01723 [Paenisporosarcina sp. HGH0030]|uniref:hypothetical protein n=1 Tax=Paenisporosarcina sp. HGH0030 TaxID=1078085 RepID=UPI00034E115D|nr:hypothetical protein [Paenisporosarcina sp. HGH0030]EPD51909.1 hypothetical protein HMPREF1210_01723 [Paenisporosarcina sp. HGH0030]
MIFDFRFWRYLANQQELIDNLDSATMRDFKKRVWMVGLFGLLLFVTQELWGMNTQHLTSVYAFSGNDPYTLARLVSLVGIILWAVLYMAFHFFGIAFILNRITGIDLPKLAVLQLYVVGILLIEKALLFIIFLMTGATTPVSLFSFGPLAATVFDHPFLVFFFNQLSIFTALIIALQVRFIRAFTDMNPRMILLIIIGIHIGMALITSAAGLLPLEEWYGRFVEGGAVK